MKQWPLQDAKARLSQLVRLASEHEPQEITLRGEPAVVVLSGAGHDQRTRPKESLVDFMRRSPSHALMQDLTPSPLAGPRGYTRAEAMHPLADPHSRGG